MASWRKKTSKTCVSQTRWLPRAWPVGCGRRSAVEVEREAAGVMPVISSPKAEAESPSAGIVITVVAVQVPDRLVEGAMMPVVPGSGAVVPQSPPVTVPVVAVDLARVIGVIRSGPDVPAPLGFMVDSGVDHGCRRSSHRRGIDDLLSPVGRLPGLAD